MAEPTFMVDCVTGLTNCCLYVYKGITFTLGMVVSCPLAFSCGFANGLCQCYPVNDNRLPGRYYSDDCKINYSDDCCYTTNDIFCHFDHCRSIFLYGRNTGSLCHPYRCVRPFMSSPVKQEMK